MGEVVNKNHDELAQAMRKLEANLIELNQASMRRMTQNTTVAANDLAADLAEIEESEEIESGGEGEQEDKNKDS